MKLKKSKIITKRITPACAVCGKKMRVVCYSNRTYRGGHYFGEIPLYRKGGLERARRYGVRERVLHGMKIQVLKKDPKPYDYAEYWECPRCYWKK